MHPQTEHPLLKPKKFQFKNGHRPGLPLNFLPLSCQVAELLPIYFQGGVHGWNLQDSPPETGQHRLHGLLRQGNLPLLKYRAGDILGVRHHTGQKQSLIGLLRMLKKLHPTGGPAHKHRQHPGGHGVQGPSMTNAPGVKHPAQSGSHVLAGPAGGLIYNYNPVHG